MVAVIARTGLGICEKEDRQIDRHARITRKMQAEQLGALHGKFVTQRFAERRGTGRADIVIVDASPVLAVSDAAIVGRMTGATLLVARSGRHPVRELEQTVKRLNQAGVQVKGFVFNDLDLNRQRYRYGYEGYVYRYSYTDKT